MAANELVSLTSTPSRDRPDGRIVERPSVLLGIGHPVFTYTGDELFWIAFSMRPPRWVEG